MGTFKKATKQQARLRLALIGPSGSGKTYSALAIATELAANGGRVAVIDTERGSASKYSDQFPFDVLELDTFHPERYIDAIADAANEGYTVLVIDSLSHAWMGKDGALQLVDDATKRSKSGNSYTAWRDVTPLQNRLLDTILQSRCHVIATMRSKTEYVIEKDDRGKSTPRKVGMAPIQRDGVEYEFDLTGDLDFDHNFAVSKTRCPALDGKVIHKPGRELAQILRAWLSDGEAPRMTADAARTAEDVRQSLADDPSGTGETPAPALATQAQMQRIKTAIGEAGWSKEAVQYMVRTRFGFESAREITMDTADAILASLQDPTMPHEIEQEMEREAITKAA